MGGTHDDGMKLFWFMVAILVIVAVLVFGISTAHAEDVSWDYRVCADKLDESFGYDNYYVFVTGHFEATDDFYAFDIWLDDLGAEGNVSAFTINSTVTNDTELVVGAMLETGAVWHVSLSTDYGTQTFDIGGNAPSCEDAGAHREDPVDVNLDPVEDGEPGECYVAYIQNGDGGESRVNDGDHPNGIVWQADDTGTVHLITGGGGQTTNAGDYRLDPVPC